ncbi:MAG: hypothetical protein F4Y44_11830 [Chloroflexi bacterium]|nr:hypothetical protein [Chloroflexota bacterium]
MVAQTMTAAEHAERALVLLAEADAGIASEDYDSVSGNLSCAVEHAIAAVSTEHGWEWEGDGHSDLLSVVERIEKECHADGISSTFRAATLWRNNRDYHFLDDYEYEFFTPSAHRFVSNALNLNGSDVCTDATDIVER